MAGRVMPVGIFRFLFVRFWLRFLEDWEFDAKSSRKVFGCFVELQSAMFLPEVEDVSLRTAGWFETAEYLAFEVR